MNGPISAPQYRFTLELIASDISHIHDYLKTLC